MRDTPMSDTAVYLGEGVWWQISREAAESGRFRGMPTRIRPWRRNG